MDQEIWRNIENYPYQVSNKEQIRTLWGRYKKDIIKQRLVGKYYMVGLTIESGNQKQFTVHTIVAKAFPEICGEWFEGAVVHHIDFDTTNNKPENLAVISREEHNRIHGNSNVTKKRRFEGQANRKDCSKRVVQYTLDGKYVKDYPSTMEAQRQTGFNRAHIGNCAKGRIKSSRGYIWRYE